jgi:hypothetical protein
MTLFYDLGIAWEWEYDFDFVSLIGKKCAKRNLSFFYITPENLSDVYLGVKNGEIKFLAYFDRASDVDENFFELNFLLEKTGTRIINRYFDMVRASDKATMHLELLNAGVELPYTVIIPPFDEVPSFEIDEKILEKVGIPFVVKPSTETGGGLGVKIGHSISDIIETRKEFPYDKYLVQEIIYPIYIDGRKAWFRGFYAFGEVLLCWWDNEAKVYDMIKDEELERYNLSEIEIVLKKIHRVCKLDFFSSEIALTSKNDEKKFVAVDYVNEIPDMRLKSKAVDGVPDEVVEKIADRMAKFVANLK